MRGRDEGGGGGGRKGRTAFRMHNATYTMGYNILADLHLKIYMYMYVHIIIPEHGSCIKPQPIFGKSSKNTHRLV